MLMTLDAQKPRWQSAPMKIVTLINQRGLTVAGVAKAAGISRAAIYYLDAEPDRTPTLQTVIALAKAIGCKPSDIRPEFEAMQ